MLRVYKYRVGDLRQPSGHGFCERWHFSLPLAQILFLKKGLDYHR